MMNKVHLIGRLTHDVELGLTKSGRMSSTTITLAVNRNFTDGGVNPNEEFIPVVVLGSLADHLAQYNGKDSLIAVTGRLQTRTHQNEDGTTVCVPEVVAEMIDYLAYQKIKSELPS